MATQRLIMTVLLLTMLGSYSCDEGNPIGGGGAIHDPFPNAVGMLWKYEVYDSLAKAVDTVWVSVTDSTLTRCGYTSYDWRMFWTARDSVVDRYALVWVDSSMVDFVTDTTCEPTMLERFVFPLKNGATWTGPSIFDTSRATEVGTVVVPAGTFRNSVLVEHAWHLDFEGGGDWTKTWLAPDAGIAYRHEYRTYSDGATITVLENRIWKLLEYDLSTFSLAQFPNTVGTEWVYQVVDTSLDLLDTVTVTIVSKVQVSWADSATLWRLVGRELQDTLYVGTESNRVYVAHDSRILLFDAWYYEFPMAVGRHWGIETFAPIPVVDDKGPVRAPAGDFQSGFHYTMGGGAFNDYWFIDDWLVPGVGVVTREYTRFGLGPMFTQEWTLLDYDIAK